MKLKIKELRLQKGLSVPELSKLSGVSPSFIYEVERGEKSITIDKLCKIAKALNVKTEDLYEC